MREHFFTNELLTIIDSIPVRRRVIGSLFLFSGPDESIELDFELNKLQSRYSSSLKPSIQESVKMEWRTKGSEKKVKTRADIDPTQTGQTPPLIPMRIGELHVGGRSGQFPLSTRITRFQHENDIFVKPDLISPHLVPLASDVLGLIFTPPTPPLSSPPPTWSAYR